MPKRLICTIGGSPQVVTETVWALMKERWRPDRIEVITTTFALKTVRENLQANDGRLAALLRAKPPVTIYLPKADDTCLEIGPDAAPDFDTGGALADVSSEGEAMSMGNLIMRRVAEAARDDATELHVSLAGGRKTMSAHALLALCLAGRPQDRASHVLVGPAEFEDHPLFWYPGQEGGLIITKAEAREAARTGQDFEPTLDPRKAKIVVVRAQHVMARFPIRDPEALAHNGLNDLARHANLAAAVDEAPELVLDTARNELRLNGETITLTAVQFALLRMMCEARMNGWGEPDANGVGGLLTFPVIANGVAHDGALIRERYKHAFEHAFRVTNPHGELVDDRTFRALEALEGSPELVEDVRDMLAPTRTHLRKALVEAFGAPAVNLIWPEGGHGAPFGLDAPTQMIRIERAGLAV